MATPTLDTDLAHLVLTARDASSHEARAAAFTGLVRRFQDMAYGCAFGLLRDHGRAQDAAQDAFVLAWQNLPQLQEPRAFPGWLRRIVLSACHGQTRQIRFRTAPLECARELPASVGRPQEEVERRLLRAELERAIARLPEGERLVVVLHYLGCYRQREIAAFLELPLTTVKKRLHTARRKLKERLLIMSESELPRQAPSRTPQFAETVRLRIQPEELKSTEYVPWSNGIGTEVWEMLSSAASGNVERMKDLLMQKPELRNCAYEYRTPLHFAVRENQLEAVRLLLDAGADASGKSGSWMQSPMEMAQNREYREMEQLLATHLAGKHQVDPKAEAIAAAIRAYEPGTALALIDAEPALLQAGDERGNQPIHWAAMTRQLPLIDALLERGAEINVRRPDGARPVHLSNGDYHYRGWRDVPKDKIQPHQVVLGYLLARGAEYDLPTAAALGDCTRIREILDADPGQVNTVPPYFTYYSGLPLRVAATNGHLAAVRLLLERGADPNVPEPGIAPFGGALRSAAGDGHLEIVRLLLEHGANPMSAVESSGSALWIARDRKHDEVARLLAAYGAVDELYNLAYSGDAVVLGAMFQANPTLAENPTALGVAAENGHAETVTLFLRHVPDLATRMNPAAAATPALTRRLLEAGMNPNHPHWLGTMQLHNLARKGDLETARLFLEFGANVNARDDEYGSTPLGWAARNGQTEMAKLLLEHGAWPEPPGPEWASARRWAERGNHTEILTLLDAVTAA